MILVSSAEVGPVALARMCRDGVLLAAAPRHGAPVDLPLGPEARASALEGVVPGHTIVSSLAGLWLLSGGDPPRTVDLVGERGLHRAKPGADAGGWVLVFHSGPAAREPTVRLGGIAVATRERCCADALRWRDLGEAIPAVLRAVGRGAADARAIQDLVRRDDPRGLGSARMRSAWGAIVETSSTPPGSAG